MSGIESAVTPPANQFRMAVVIDVVRRQSDNLILGLDIIFKEIIAV
jgi:hypothetical protein